MVIVLAVTFGYLFLLWLVFFRLKLLKFSIAWGLVSAFVGAHALLGFLIGLRFVAPYTTNATVIQHTIQLIPRLPEPTLVTEVLVEPNVPVKKGQPLFQFDRRPYEYKVRQFEAALAQAEQGVSVLQADLDAAVQQIAKRKSDLVYAQAQGSLQGPRQQAGGLRGRPAEVELAAPVGPGSLEASPGRREARPCQVRCPGRRSECRGCPGPG